MKGHTSPLIHLHSLLPASILSPAPSYLHSPARTSLNKPCNTEPYTIILCKRITTMAEDNSAPVVDEASINHPSAARRNSLEKLLAHRPDRAELVESKRPR